MLRKLLFLLLAAVLAWFLGPTLSSLFSGGVSLAGNMPTGVGDYFTKRDANFYGHFILWLIMLCFLLPLLFTLFGVFAPQARRYGTTKLLRRVHGVTTELFLVAVLFLVTTVLFGLLAKTSQKEILRLTEQSLNQSSTNSIVDVTPAKLDAMWPELVSRYAQEISNNRAAFTNYLNMLASALAGSLDIKPEYYDIERNFFTELSRQIEQKNRDARTTIPINIGGDYKYKPTQLPPPTEYSQIRSNHLKLVAERDTGLSQFNEFRSQFHPGGKIHQVHLEAAQKSLSGLGMWRRYVLIPLPIVWPYSLLAVSLFWLLVHVFFKAEFSAIHHVFARFLDEGRFGLGGSGRFAGLFEEWGLISRYQEPGALLSMCLSPLGKEHLGVEFGNWLAKKRRTPEAIKRTEIFLGRSLYNPFLNIGMSGDQHMLTIAPSRTGKGATAIIPNLLLWEGSALVIDPKGTNAAVTAERRRQMGQKVHLVDPFGIVEKNEEARACFNPLEGLNPDSDTIREDIGVIADALVVPDQEAKEKHWDDGARTILCGLIGQLITGYENPSLPLLRELLALPQDKQDELWATMFLNPGAGSAPRDAASRIIRGAGTNEISGLISNADKHTEWLSYTAMQKTLSRSTFSFAELKEQPTTIYLILPPEYLGLHNRFLRLFINMAILQMAKGGRSKIPVLMVLDEFLALGHMAEVEKALGLMAGYNLILWPIIQDLARLKDLYKNSVNSFIANSRAVQVFGVTDPQTTEYISKQLGNSAASVLPTGKFSTFVPLRSPDEVARDIVTNSNRQYILRAGQPPLILEKVPYFKGGLFGGAYPGLFHGKYTPDPDHGA